jgi:hypothetical protein
VFDITPEIARGSFHRQTRQQMSANGKTDVPAKLQCMYIRWIHLGLGLTWTNERLHVTTAWAAVIYQWTLLVVDDLLIHHHAAYRQRNLLKLGLSLFHLQTV